MITLYKRNAQGKPLIWSIEKIIWSTGDEELDIKYGLVGGTLHEERVKITKSKVDELQSRINAKRKEGYKELSELKDSGAPFFSDTLYDTKSLIIYLEAYLPKYSTTSEGFVLPMLAKVLEDNKPFDKYGTMLGQWKIDGLRCIIGAYRNSMDMFKPIGLTYHSRTGENWTNKMSWFDDILLPKLSKELIAMMVEEGACLDGELYLPGYSVNDINSFVKNTSLPEHYKLQYWCYDICVENMSAEARNTFRFDNFVDKDKLDDNFLTKEAHLNNKKQVIVLQSWDVTDINEATLLRDIFINRGFEGLIIRNPNAEYQFGKFIIVDIISEHKRSDLPLFVCRNDINDELFECSLNAPQDKQREILINKDKYIGKYMQVEFRARSGVSQVPFHARAVNIII